MVISIFKQPVDINTVQYAATESFGDMAKAVVDIEREILALGGELHADAEEVLLKDGSRQDDLWGINLYPERSVADWIEYSSLINIRPKSGNRSVIITDEGLRAKIRAVVDWLIPRV